MCNAATDLRIFAAAALVCGMLASCSSSDKEKAQALLDQASVMVDNGQYQEAMTLLDSIDHAYPAEVDARREAMHLRPLVIEKTTLAELATTDSLLVVTQIQSDSVANYIAKVDNPVEPYYVASEFKGKDPAAAPGLYARMSPDGQFYILSSVNRPVNSTSVTITIDGDGISAQSAIVPHDGERNDKFGNVEIITFMQSECDTIGSLAAKNQDKSFTLSFNGGKQYTMPLPKNQLKALGDVYTASKLLRDLKVLQIRKTRLEKQLELARNQQARTFNDKNEGDE